MEFRKPTPDEIKQFWEDIASAAREVESWPAWRKGLPYAEVNEPKNSTDPELRTGRESD